MERGCNCGYGKNKSSCIKFLSFEVLVEYRMECIEFLFIELDLVVFGTLNSFMNLLFGKKRYRMSYFFRGV